MKKLRYLISIGCLLLIGGGHAFAAGGAMVPVRLEHNVYDQSDIASIKRGAKIFAVQCMVCHSMKQLRYNKLAKEAGITIDKMPVKDQNWWFGATPPDLSLVARARSPDWIYTYLHSFYKDDTSKLGSNNLLVRNSSMPNPFLATQGEQIFLKENVEHPGSVITTQHRYSTYLKLVRQGSLSAEQFNKQTYDLVNFLVYAAEPAQLQRQNLGWWVLGFLSILIVLTYLLRKEYWKTIK